MSAKGTQQHPLQGPLISSSGAEGEKAVVVAERVNVRPTPWATLSPLRA